MVAAVGAPNDAHSVIWGLVANTVTETVDNGRDGEESFPRIGRGGVGVVHLRVAAGVTVLMAASVSSQSTVASPLADDAPGDDKTISGTQSPDDALAEDLGLVADARGWTVEEGDAYHRAERAIGRIAERVAKARPAKFVGSALSSDPHGAPTLYVKGAVDQLITDLVAGAEIEIIVADGQPFSFFELEDRAFRVHEAIRAQGFESVATGFDITRAGVITTTITPPRGLEVSSEAILSRLPADLRSSVELTIREEP